MPSLIKAGVIAGKHIAFKERDDIFFGLPLIMNKDRFPSKIIQLVKDTVEI